MAEEAGFQIGKKLYPFPTRFRLGDTVLVEALTRLTWPQFVDRLPADDDAPEDPITMLGLLAISVSQKNPTWRIDRVVDYVRNLGMEDVEFVGPTAEEDIEGDADPPPIRGENGQTASSPPAKPSTSGSEQTGSDEKNLPSFGTPTSVTSPESFGQ